MTAYFDITNLTDTIDALVPMGSSITALVLSFVGLIIAITVVGFITGVFDDLLDGLRGMFTINRRR